MIVSRRLFWAWCALIVLTLINYQVVVILFNDFLLLKFLRDIILIYIIIQTFLQKPCIKNTYFLCLLILLCVMIPATMRTKNLGTAVVNLRRYLFPVGVLIAARSFAFMQRKDYISILRFLLNLTAILSLWGIFQAYVLGDRFLIKMGYPTMYAYAYKKEMLGYSYYFGNLGIQRVVSTISNSNVCALILGSILITVIFRFKELVRTKWDWVKLACIALAYILTVSRANFLAMLIVGLILIWKYIPFKKYLWGLACAALAVFVVMYFYQDDNGITHKLVNWVVSSLTLKESSAAGRAEIWKVAFEGVKQNPFGIGFGKVGSFAQGSGVQEFYHSENSYLSIALDMGWTGLAGYLIWLGNIAVDARSIKQKAPITTRMVQSLLVYLMITFVFSNHIYDMEAVTLVYFLIGITLCPNATEGGVQA